MNTVPSAKTVRELLGHLDFGPYRVFFDPSEEEFPWKVLGPPVKHRDLRYELKDEYATYRQAVRNASARSRGEFGRGPGDQAPARTNADRVAKHRKAALSYPSWSPGRRYHEEQMREHIAKDPSRETALLRRVVALVDETPIDSQNVYIVREAAQAILEGRKVRIQIGELPRPLRLVDLVAARAMRDKPKT